MRANQGIIKMPSESVSCAGEILHDFVKSVLGFFLPEFDENILEEVSQSASLNTAGLTMTLLDSWSCDNLLEQYSKQCILFPPKIVDFYKHHFPDMDQLKPGRLEDCTIGRSPYAKCIEDEDFISEMQRKMDHFVNGDTFLAKLLMLLSIFSPVGVSISDKDQALLKYFLQKLSIMIYNHLMKR